VAKVTIIFFTTKKKSIFLRFFFNIADICEKSSNFAKIKELKV